MSFEKHVIPPLFDQLSMNWSQEVGNHMSGHSKLLTQQVSGETQQTSPFRAVINVVRDNFFHVRLDLVLFQCGNLTSGEDWPGKSGYLGL